MQPLHNKDESDSDSDSEDLDYVPPAEEPSDDEGEGRAKRQRKDLPESTVKDQADKEKTREALWTEFQASVSEGTAPQLQDKPKLVKIEKKYRFAGDDVIEVKEVPEDSDEAKKWPRWPPVATTPSAAPTASSTAVNVAATPDNPTEDTGSKVGLLPSVPSSSSIPSDTLSVKLKRRPGPRKSKILDISSSSGPAAKKLTTLDKSLMDWRSHVTSQDQSGSGLKDELEANRRGGGYLEKVEFLQRVGERKEEALEASKSTKRRRPL